MLIAIPIIYSVGIIAPYIFTKFNIYGLVLSSVLFGVPEMYYSIVHHFSKIEIKRYNKKLKQQEEERKGLEEKLEFENILGISYDEHQKLINNYQKKEDTTKKVFSISRSIECCNFPEDNTEKSKVKKYTL